MLPIMAAASPPGPMLEESRTVAMSKSWNRLRTQVDVSALSGSVWPVSPVRNSLSSVSSPRHGINSWAFSLVRSSNQAFYSLFAQSWWPPASCTYRSVSAREWCPSHCWSTAWGPR